MTILVCGEALYDFFQTGTTPDGDGLTFEARFGGSPFNVAIGIARQGGNVALLTGISTDLLGQRLVAQLQAGGVDVRHVVRSDRCTTLSLVGLDDQGHPDYAFYGNGSADLGLTGQDVPDLGEKIHALHFASYSMVLPPAANAYAGLAERYRTRFLSLDPNVRPTIQPDVGVWRARIDRLRMHCNLIKVSTEDIALLYPGQAPAETARGWLGGKTELVIVTAGSEGATAFTATDQVHAPGQRIDVVDTVGAGDAFQATALRYLQSRGAFAAGVGWIETIDINDMLKQCIHVSAVVCTRIGADMPRVKDPL